MISWLSCPPHRTKTAPEQHWAPSMLHCRRGRTGFSFQWMPLSHGFTQHYPKTPWFIYELLSTLESTFLLLLICTGVCHGVQAWMPSMFTVCLPVQVETSVPASNKAWCRLFSVIQVLLTTCLVKNLVAVNNFLFLLHPLSVTTSFNLKPANLFFFSLVKQWSPMVS